MIYRAFKTLSPRLRTATIVAPDPTFDPYITDYITDFQYWDLAFLDLPTQPLPEVAGPRDRPRVAVLGQLNEKKSRSELLELVRDYPGEWPFELVVAGRVDEEAGGILGGHPSVRLVNRYLEAGEIMHLYGAADLIWAYYSRDTNRPSGIFGRSIQLGRPVLVRRA